MGETLVKRLRLARANGDPNKYVAFLTVAEAHAAAQLIEEMEEALHQCLGSLKALGAERGYAADAARAAIAKVRHDQ